MFRIEKEPFGPIDQYLIINESSGESLGILPRAGGRMNELVLRKRGKLYSVLAGYSSYKSFLTDGIAQFRGAKLFPYPGRVMNAEFTSGGKTLQLPRNDYPRPHSVHGLVHDAPLEIAGMSAGHNRGELNLTFSSDGSCAGYPFSWSLSVSYVFDAEAVTITTAITNTGDVTMPAGDGWHPYFTLNKKVNELVLNIESEKYLEFDPTHIPTGNLVSDNRYKEGSLIGDDPLHRCYVLDPSPGIHCTRLKDPHENVALEIWQEKGPQKYNFLQLYIPPDRESLAIEPYTCPSNALNSGVGLVTLEKGASLTLSMGIRIV